MRSILFLSLTAAMLVAGCTMITHIHEHPVKPVVVHDTVFVESPSAPESESWSGPGQEGQYEHGESAPPTGRITFEEMLDPGTAMVETIIDYDNGVTSHRMYGNVLSGFGLRFELNMMIISYSSGFSEYYLVPQFSTLRNWDGFSSSISDMSGATSDPGDGSVIQINDPSVDLSRAEAPGISHSSSSEDRTFLSLIVGRDTWEYSGGDLDDYDCEGLTIGRYEITVRIPVSRSVLTRLAAGNRGDVHLADEGESQQGTISEENFINFSSFMAVYSE